MKFNRIIAAATAFFTLTGAINAYAAGVEVIVNGDSMQNETITTENGVYISLEELAQKIGADLTWDEATQSARLEISSDKKVVEMIESVSESVVAIVGNYKDSSLSSDAQDYNELYAHGAGAVIDSEGVIITNAHVVKDIQNLTVVFGDGASFPGTVLYVDEISDLALVKINRQNLKPIKFAQEGSLKVGESVVAIGTPLSVNLINSATKGIVSGIGVNIGQHYLFTQSDVAINGGNSGGPLVNMKGELVGINSIKYVGSEIEGMSFSIPVDTINYVLDSFRQYGRVIRPDTGVNMTESWESKIGVPTTKGLTVTSSDNELLMAGDMITHVNGYEVHSIADYNEALKKSFDGKAVEFTYTRGGVSNAVMIEAEADLEKDTDARVEISFTVGNSTLMINGFRVEVETPYIAGAGTTLVPLRVITEAFGATVEWQAEDNTITLTYPENTIVLQAGNTIAKVNGEEVELAVAPEIVGEGVTMVPLRFIAETFGATVDYDGETGRITVVREAEEESGTIKFSTDLPRVGDSYWNWSMLTPTSMMMSDRTLDGTQTEFYDESGDIAIAIVDLENDDEYADYTSEEIFEEIYDEEMYYNFEDLTLSKNEKSTDSLGNPCFRMTGRSKYAYYDTYCVVRDKTVFMVGVYGDIETAPIKTYSNLIESFKVEFAANDEEKEQTYDLSNVDEDGYRPMEDEDLKVSCKVPADFSEGYTGYYSVNTLSYVGEDDESLNLAVYSKSESVNAESLINSEVEFAKKYYNSEYATISEITQMDADFAENVYMCKITNGEEEIVEEVTEVATEEATEEITEEATEEETVSEETETEEEKIEGFVTYMLFFEKGEYVYEMTVVSEKDGGKFFNKVMETLEVKELDEDDMGVLVRPERNFTEKKFSEGDWSFTLNSAWNESYAYEDYASFTNPHTTARLYLDITDAKEAGYSSAKSAVEAALKDAQTTYKDKELKVLKSVTQVNLGENSFYTFSIKYTTEDYYGEAVTKYYSAYVMKKGGKFYSFELTEVEQFANAQTKLDVEAALGTFKVEAKQ